MTRPVFLYAPDPAVAGGGADLRARALLSRLDVDPLILVREPLGWTGEVVVPAARHDRLDAALCGVPPRYSREWSRVARSIVAGAVEAAPLIIASTLWSAALVPPQMRDRMVYDAHNVEWDVSKVLSSEGNLLRRAAYGITGPWTRLFEKRVVSDARSVWAVSEHDAEALTGMGAAEVVVLENGVDVPDEMMGPSDAQTLCFVGSLTATVNSESVRWFIDEVWSLVRSRVPTAQLVVAGRGGDVFDDPANGVSARGWVEDLRDVYAASRAAIAPIRLGSGTRLKIPEAQSFGIPAVSTALGAAGRTTGRDAGVLIGDSPDVFADHCVELLEDVAFARDLGRKAYGAATALGWDAIAATAQSSLDTSLSSRNHVPQRHLRSEMSR